MAWDRRAVGTGGCGITVEEELPGFSGREELVDEFNHIWLREKILQESRVVIAAKVERLLELGCKPPVPLIHLASYRIAQAQGLHSLRVRSHLSKECRLIECPMKFVRYLFYMRYTQTINKVFDLLFAGLLEAHLFCTCFYGN